MATPSLRATSSAAAGVTEPSTLSIGAPTGVAGGDLLIAAVHRGETTSVTAPAGWIQYVATTSTAAVTVFYRVATTSEPSTYTFTLGGFPRFATGVILDYHLSGVDMSSANLEASYTAHGSGTAPGISTVKNTFATDLVVWLAAWQTGSTLTGPSGFTQEVVVGIATSLPVGAWQKAPGSSTTASYFGSLPASSGWGCAIVVLSPASTPNACTLTAPATGSYQTVASGKTFKAKYNSTDGAAANKYAMRIKKETASAYSYWNATTAKLQATEVWNACSVTPAGTITVTLGTGVLSDGYHYQWSIAAQEQEANLRGPFATDNLFTASTGPTLTVRGPFGTETTGKPTVKWTASPSSTTSIIKYRVKVFTTAVRNGSGFTPTTSTATYDSGTISGHASTLTVTTTLDNQTKYYAYVRVKETGTLASSWAWSTFTVSFDAPAKPTVTAVSTTTPTTSCPYIEVTVQCHDNLLSANDASFEGGVGEWVAEANTTIAQATPPVAAPDGNYALELTPTAAGTLAARTSTGTSGFAVEPSTAYTLICDFLASADARSCTVSVTWYTQLGVTLSTSSLAAVTDSTTAWTRAKGKVTAPSTAAYAAVKVSVATVSGTADIHWLDTVGLFPGTVATWTAGGFAGASQVRVTRKTTTTTRWSKKYKPFWVRTASTLHPKTVPVPSQKVVVKTFEAVQGTKYTYTGVTLANSGTNHSGTGTPSAEVTLNTTPKRWWQLDPTSPTGATNAQPTNWQPSQTVQASAHQVMGQTTMQYIGNVALTQDFQVTFVLFAQSVYKKLRALAESQKAVWISSPWGDEDSGWFIIGPQPGGLSTGLGQKVRTATLHPSVSTAPYRDVTFTAISAVRPTV